MTANPNLQLARWHVYENANDVAERVATAILHIADETLKRLPAFRIVLAGGTTPAAIYRIFEDAESAWLGWHVYFGDERSLPADHPERNSVMAHDIWLGRGAVPASHVHAIPAELGADEAASVYRSVVEPIDLFDVVLLGLGEDGHTASLFPDHAWGEDVHAAAALAVHNAPKPPPERVTLSARRLSQARHVFFIVTGAAKRDPVSRWRHGQALPAAAIRPVSGVDVFLDRAAAGD